MSRSQLIAPFLFGVLFGPLIVLILGFSWEVVLISPLIGGVSFASAAVRAHNATRFFKSLIPQPNLERRRAEVARAPSGFPTVLHAARHAIVDIRFGLATMLITVVAVLLHEQGAPIWQTLLLGLGGPALMVLAMTRQYLP